MIVGHFRASFSRNRREGWLRILRQAAICPASAPWNDKLSNNNLSVVGGVPPLEVRLESNGYFWKVVRVDRPSDPKRWLELLMKESPRNERKTPHSEAAIEALVASIAAMGILQNLVVERELDGEGTAMGFLCDHRRGQATGPDAWGQAQGGR